ncbi:nuclease [Sphingopyxis sp. Root214]|uniref:NERD domain-containing protein n=1 Tax=unclassified Sphingopyxis TaxID=2614943 RepID=UPI0006F3F7A7|nr:MULTISPECIES: NERD domain-containing protein/DEAD/DEAH box helicase [unclassified Sphingopyxis]KQZ73912.1 nuclease [Sphingopyxis sp. Root154]KRC08052.1 nuclease [Sphingopyxis sp. Root214]
MARYIGLGSDQPIEDSERRVAEALRRLPDGWVVLHHVSWQSKRGGRQGDGEADFIVLHPRKGVIVLEVKGGGIDVDRGRWITTDRFGKRHDIKNPYEQATASKHALVGWLRDHGLGARVRVGHAVVFPHMDAVPSVGPVAPSQITISKTDLLDIGGAIARCLAHWSLEANLPPKDVEKVISLLAPTVSASPTLASASGDAEANLIVFTAEQIEAFSRLRAHRGGLILGGAGTGKTVLAIARAQQLAKDGFRTLLVCFNELLGAELAERVGNGPDLTAGTFHSICLREAHRAGIPVSNKRDQAWWEDEAPSVLIDACSSNETIYDAIVVDEGQDFSPIWLDALRCVTRGVEAAPFFVFADPRQDLWRRGWDLDAAYPFVWELTRNMRNTLPIAKRVAAIVGGDAQGRGIPGPDPIWRTSEGPAKERDIVSAVEDLLDEGFGPTNLVVLCGSSRMAERLRERSIGPFSFGLWGSRGLPVETIARFKGLESQAIILALDGPFAADGHVSAYVGISRARSVLVVVGDTADMSELSWQTS